MAHESREELLAELTEHKARITELYQQYDAQNKYLDPKSDDGQEWNRLNLRVDELHKILDQKAAMEARVFELDKDPGNQPETSPFFVKPPGATRGEDIFDLTTVRSMVTSPEGARHELQERAKRFVDQAHFPHPKADEARCKEYLSALVATADNERGDLSRRVLAAGSPTYQRAFGKHILGQVLTAQEISALSLTNDAGGYAVPTTLDPTLIPTSDGIVNPLRRISRVVQLSGSNTWKGVTAGAVTAHRRNEGDEVEDDSPTLTQPSATVSRVDVFIPFSMEIQQDWGAMQTEMARLIQDAKDTEEATSFVTGAGTGNVPQGIITGATVTTTAGGTAAFASTDLDQLEEDLPPRFRARAEFLGNRAIYNAVRHFDAYGGPDLWVNIASGLQQGGNTGRTLLGYPANEVSTMHSDYGTNDKFLVFGDFSHFLILDRIGMNVELVPHLFGSSRHYPTGQRGFFAFWRNTSKVLVPGAFRVLKGG